MSPKRKNLLPLVSFITLGCKANQYDSAAMMALADPARFRVVEQSSAGAGSEPASVYVINTCTVTHRSDFQSRQMVRRARRQNPGARIIVTGCMAQTGAASLLAAGADLVLGPSDRDQVVKAIAGVAPPGPIFFHPQGGSQSRGRAVAKVQDGCNSRCAYCVVSIARGPSRSLSLDQALDQLKALVQKGFQEIVLTGIHLGLYGIDHGTSLLELLRLIEAGPGMPRRIRLSSLEPQEASPELIDFIAHSKIICPHLHLPLQSGDAGVLKRMRRPYAPAEFERIVQAFKDARPEAAVGVDLIAGFPGEDRAAHQNTLELVERLPLTHFHVFPFSKRPGVEAAAMDHQVPPPEIKARARQLRDLGAVKRAEFMQAQIGRVLQVLVEGAEGGTLRGASENYLRVEFTGGQPVGSITSALIKSGGKSSLKGEEISLPPADHQGA